MRVIGRGSRVQRDGLPEEHLRVSVPSLPGQDLAEIIPITGIAGVALGSFPES